MTQRWVAGVEYDGRGFYGWQIQRQAGLRTVQECAERALAKIATHPVRVFCAGRTDTGVHAVGQIIHFDTNASRDPRSWLLGANSNMPDDAKFTWMQPVDKAFHARFLATGRSYRYLIHNNPSRSALWHGRCFEWPSKVNLEHLQQAADMLHGWHDFSSFRGKDCQAKTPRKLMRHIAAEKHGPWIVIDIEANGFLHNMVRNIVGTLLEIGTGQRPVSWMQDVLDARQRAAAGQSAPPGGLYFMRADYPEEFGLPVMPRQPFPL